MGVCLEDCLQHDPRWDPQIEERELYYASVVSATGLPVSHVHGILTSLAQEGEATRCYGQYQVAGVLGVLAVRGNEEALHALRHEVRRGPAWRACVEELAERLEPNQWMPLGDQLFARLDDPEVEELAEEHLGYEPWQAWSESVARYSTALESQAEAAPPQAKALLVKPRTDMPTQRLLEIVEQRNWIKIGRILAHRKRREDASTLIHAVRTGTALQRAVALKGLEALGDGSVLEDALGMVQDEAFRIARHSALRYLASLPPELTLERARSWARKPWPLRLAGQAVLERHATEADTAMLRGALRDGMDQEDMYLACFAVDALARIHARQAQPELRAYYETTPYAFGRWRVAKALAQIEDDFARTTAIECLHDCESSARLVGISHVDRAAPGVCERLDWLGKDPAEDEEVSQAASTS